ncbi:hypothetical protein LWI29_024507 [Acer saccharum]|uniref:Uncharacterized protein n=1 Tax=Acer saccharum TaxID=4024 RepID=A0AA39SFR3_ACESA|nr:hypothetical protein LWI29_024507 [Acer saccharum]
MKGRSIPEEEMIAKMTGATMRIVTKEDHYGGDQRRSRLASTDEDVQLKKRRVANPPVRFNQHNAQITGRIQMDLYRITILQKIDEQREPESE